MKASKVLRSKSAAQKGFTKGRKFTRPILESEEWFFGKVPQDEILTCFYYEYARSRKDIRELVYRWRKRLAGLDQAHVDTLGERLSREWRWHEEFPSREDATRAFWSELTQLTDRTCSQLLINLPEFPDVAWQMIRPSKRAKWKRLLTATRDRYPDGI